MLFLREKYLKKFLKFKDNDNILLILWARQVGKTSFVKSLIENWYISNYVFLNWEEFISTDFLPKDFVEYLDFNYDIWSKDFLIIDEAQNIKNTWLILKYFVDLIKTKNLKLKLIILWSWSLQMFQWFTDSLVWRYDILHIYPFDFEEFLQTKGLNTAKIDVLNAGSWVLQTVRKYFDQYKMFGGYPKVVFSKTFEGKKLAFKNIIDSYLLKDVLWFINKKEIWSFEKFLKFVVLNVGSLIKIDNIAKSLYLTRSEVEKFLNIVNYTYIFYQLRPFFWKLSYEIKKSTKWYCNDIWWINYFIWFEDVFGDIKGKIIENFVFNQILANKKDYLEVQFWQNKNRSEVDFVLVDSFEKRLIPIEVKTKSKDIVPKALLSFINLYKENIGFAIVTTDGVNKVREIDWVKIYFVDYRLIGIFLDR